MNAPGRRGLVVATVGLALLAAACGRRAFSPNDLGGSQQGGGALSEQAGTALSIKASHSNVTYCTDGGVDLPMDIYMPTSSSGGSSPAVVYAHGGAWHAGDKSTDRVNPETGTQLVAGWITALQHKGFLVAAIDYRLAPKYRFPDPVEDVKCAVRFLRAKAGTYHIDPNKIGAFGGSAGGQLVSLLGTADKSAGWDVGQYTDQSSKVQAVVDLFGPADMELFAQEHPNAVRGLGFIFGPPSTFRTFSPVTYVSAGDAPTLIIQGEADPVVSPQQSQTFFNKLQSAGVPAQLVLVKNAAHDFVPSPEGAKIDPSPTQIQDDIVNWFVKYLG